MKNTYFIYPLELMHEKVVNPLLLLLTLEILSVFVSSLNKHDKLEVDWAGYT